MAALPRALFAILMTTMAASIDVDYDDTSAFDRLDAVIRTSISGPTIPIQGRTSSYDSSSNAFAVAGPPSSFRYLEYTPKSSDSLKRSHSEYTPKRSDSLKRSSVQYSSNRRNYDPTFNPPLPSPSTLPPPAPKAPLAVKTEAPGFLDFWFNKLFPNSQNRDGYEQNSLSSYDYGDYEVDYKQNDISALEKTGIEGASLPTIHDDPLINKLFYWTVAGIALPLIFGVPFGKVEISNGRRKRGTLLR